jgi:hypothetical protein
VAIAIQVGSEHEPAEPSFPRDEARRLQRPVSVAGQHDETVGAPGDHVNEPVAVQIRDRAHPADGGGHNRRLERAVAVADRDPDGRLAVYRIHQVVGAAHQIRDAVLVEVARPHFAKRLRKRAKRGVRQEWRLRRGRRSDPHRDQQQPDQRDRHDWTRGDGHHVMLRAMNRNRRSTATPVSNSSGVFLIDMDRVRATLAHATPRIADFVPSRLE